MSVGAEPVSGLSASRDVGEPELEAVVRRGEAEAAVAPVGVLSALVAGQLNQRTSAIARLLDRPPEELVPDAPTAEISANPDRLDLRAPGTMARETGHECQLKGPNDSSPRFRDDHKQLGGIGIELGKALM